MVCKIEDYDLLVIGTGTSGTSAASICASGGLKVGIVDELPLGGTCALRGCTPKKVLVGASALAEHANRMKYFDVISSDIKFDWHNLMKFKRSFTDPVPRNRQKYYDKMGIDVFKGTATFVDSSTMKVDNKEIKAKKYVIASGAKPRRLNIPGESLVKTSEDFLELEELPDSLIFIGGGFVSFEFAHVAAKFGAEVTVIHRGQVPLASFDKTIVNRFLKASENVGVKTIVNSPVISVDRDKNQYAVKIFDSSEYIADCVVHGAGRVPNIDKLKLALAKVDHSLKGIKVNEYMQSVSNPNVYAVGDVVAGTPPLKTVSEREGNVAGLNLLNRNKIKMDYSVVPLVLFSIPELASVGIDEEQAKEQGLDFIVKETDMSDWFSSSYIGAEDAYAKIIIERESNVILGAHLMAPRAGDMINLLALAIKLKVDTSILKEIPWGFPTNTSDIRHIL